MSNAAVTKAGASCLGWMRAAEGLRHRRAITLLVGAFVLAVLLALLGLATQSGTFILLMWFVAWLCVLVGSNAAGGVLMDAARGVPQRGIGDALYSGAANVGRYFIISLLAGLFFLAYLLALAIILFICKIPGIGPLLYAIVFPVLVVASAVVAIGLAIGMFLAGPAAWEGNSVRAACAKVMAIAAQRLPEVLIGAFLLNLLMLVIIAILWLIVLAGLSIVGGLSASILGANISYAAAGLFSGLGGIAHGLGGIAHGLGGGGEGSGYIYAAVFGVTVLAAIACGALLSAMIMGVNLIYLQASAGLDTAAVEAALSQRLEQAKQKAGDVQERVIQRAQEVQERSRRAAATPPAAATPIPPAPQVPAVTPESGVAAKCPQCGAPLITDDPFCGSCGHRLE